LQRGSVKAKIMEIAIPLFETRISPRFDCAPKALLVTVDIEGKKIIETREVILKNNCITETINDLKSSGVSTVICGGVSNEMLNMLVANDIEVIPWVTGDARKAVRLFLQGKLVSGTMLSPGRRMRRWRFCQQGRKRRGSNR